MCDVWSVGVIMFAMLSGKTPFLADTADELYAIISEGKIEFPPEKWDHISDAGTQPCNNTFAHVSQLRA